MNFPEWADFALTLAAVAASLCMLIGIGLSILGVGLWVFTKGLRFWSRRHDK